MRASSRPTACKSPSSSSFSRQFDQPSTHNIYARRDRRRANKIDKTNGRRRSMVNWIRKLSRRGGPCSPLPDRVIRCRWNWWARITHSTLMTADSCCSSNLQVTDAVNQFPSITLSPRLLMTTHVMNIVNTGVKTHSYKNNKHSYMYFQIINVSYRYNMYNFVCVLPRNYKKQETQLLQRGRASLVLLNTLVSRWRLL